MAMFLGSWGLFGLYKIFKHFAFDHSGANNMDTGMDMSFPTPPPLPPLPAVVPVYYPAPTPQTYQDWYNTYYGGPRPAAAAAADGADVESGDGGFPDYFDMYDMFVDTPEKNDLVIHGNPNNEYSENKKRDVAVSGQQGAGLASKELPIGGTETLVPTAVTTLMTVTTKKTMTTAMSALTAQPTGIAMEAPTMTMPELSKVVVDSNGTLLSANASYEGSNLKELCKVTVSWLTDGGFWYLFIFVGCVMGIGLLYNSCESIMIRQRQKRTFQRTIRVQQPPTGPQANTSSPSPATIGRRAGGNLTEEEKQEQQALAQTPPMTGSALRFENPPPVYQEV